MAASKVASMASSTPSAPSSSSSSPSSGASATSPLVSHLDNGSLPMLQLRSAYRQELANLLILAPARTALVIERSLSGPLGLIADPDFLRQLGIETMYYLTADEELQPPSSISHFLYLVRPTVPSLVALSRQIIAHRQHKAAHRLTYSLILTPRATSMAESVLELQGVRADISSISSFAYDLIPLEWDVLSLEDASSFRQCWCDGDPSSLYCVARGIMRLQAVFGLIPVLRGKGSQAVRVGNLMQRMRREMEQVFKDTGVIPSSGAFAFPAVSEIDELVLIDRTTDLLTPMLTQLTYEGLIDETFAIRYSTIDVDASILNTDKGSSSSSSSNASSASPSAAAPSGVKKKLLLTSTDTVFEEIRDQSFRSIGALLSRKLTAVHATFEQRRDAMSVQELKAYMTRFKTAHTERQWLTVHVSLAEQIAVSTTKNKLFDRRLEVERAMVSGEGSVEECEEYIESLIAKQAPLLSVLRLLSIMSLTSGIRSRKYDSIKRELLQTYGYSLLFLLGNMERLGLLSAQRRKYDVLRRPMRLWSEQGWKDSIGYVYEGYAPLSVRLIEMGSVTVGGWKNMDDIMANIPGTTFELKQDRKTAATAPAATASASSAAAAAAAAPAASAGSREVNLASLDEKPLVLVFFIGGVTFAEISALRWLSSRDGHPKEYLIATTKLINGNSLIDSLHDSTALQPQHADASGSAGR